MLTWPACSTTIAGPAGGGSPAKAPARTAPAGSAASVVTCLPRPLRPSPTTPSALHTELWASAPTYTATGGAPTSPSASTSQPAAASTASRAAVSAMTFAPVAPLHSAPSPGIPSVASSPATALRSNAAAPGLVAADQAFWSHAVVSQSAAAATGSAPPVTKPK